MCVYVGSEQFSLSIIPKHRQNGSGGPRRGERGHGALRVRVLSAALRAGMRRSPGEVSASASSLLRVTHAETLPEHKAKVRGPGGSVSSQQLSGAGTHDSCSAAAFEALLAAQLLVLTAPPSSSSCPSSPPLSRSASLPPLSLPLHLSDIIISDYGDSASSGLNTELVFGAII